MKLLTEQELQLLLDAVNDKRLSDRTVRMVVRDVLDPVSVTDDDIAWARGEVAKIEEPVAPAPAQETER